MDLRLFRRRLIIVALVLGLCIAGTSLTLFQRAQHASAATAPYFTTQVGGQTYLAQYVGHAYSNQNGYSIYSDFGQWNEYTVDAYGTWHWFGQFSGNEDVYYNGNGKIQGGININVPGIGNIYTYAHDQVLNPSLGGPSYPYYPDEGESLLGTRYFQTYSGSYADCAVDEANFNNTTNYGLTNNFYNLPGNPLEGECSRGASSLSGGDVDLKSFYNQFQQSAVAPHVNSPVVASLHRQQVIPLPVILGVAGGVFFISSVVAGAICNFASCSKSVQTTLAAVALGMGIISGVLGISAGIITSLRAYAASSSVLASSVINESVGTVEMEGVLRGGVAAASNEADTMATTRLTRSYSYP